MTRPQIHIRFYRRRDRKWITTVTGLPEELDPHVVARELSSVTNNCGFVSNLCYASRPYLPLPYDDGTPILQFQGAYNDDGDYGNLIKKWFIEEGIARNEDVIVYDDMTGKPIGTSDPLDEDIICGMMERARSSQGYDDPSDRERDENDLRE